MLNTTITTNKPLPKLPKRIQVILMVLVKFAHVMSYQNGGASVFVGMEHLTINPPEISGTIVLQHNGVFSQGVAQSQFNVIADSGTDNLKQFIGHGEFTSTENGQADYLITLHHD